MHRAALPCRQVVGRQLGPVALQAHAAGRWPAAASPTLQGTRPASPQACKSAAMFAGLRLAAWLPYTGAAPATPGRGFDSPYLRRNSRAGYPTAAFLLRSAFRFYGGTCGEGRKPLPEPQAGLSTPHVLPPSFDSAGGRFFDLSLRSHHG